MQICSVFLDPNNDDVKRQRNLVKNKGKIVYTNFDQYKNELLNNRPMLIELRSWLTVALRMASMKKF